MKEQLVQTFWSFAAFLILLISIGTNINIVGSVPISHEVPEVGNNSIEVPGNSTTTTSTSSSISGECRYKGLTYTHNAPVPITTDPCLSCHCRGRVVVCKLRVCPPVPKDPPPGCLIVERKKNCCPELICPEYRKIVSREQRFSIDGTIHAVGPEVERPQVESLLGHELTSTSTGFCVHEGTVYAEGSAMKSGTSNCDHCFCIKGQMKCSSPQCVIPISGCRPKYRSNACCPTNYDCNDSTESTYLTTMRPISTVVPSEFTFTSGSSSLSVHPPNFLKGCRVRGAFIYEGEPVLPLQLEPGDKTNHTSSTATGINPCQTCFCMGGVIRCRDLECNQPIAGCTAIRAEGHCCPDRYDCNQTMPIPHTDPISLSTNQLKPELGSREERRSRERPAPQIQIPEDDEQDAIALTMIPVDTTSHPSPTTPMIEFGNQEVVEEGTKISEDDEQEQQTTLPPTWANDEETKEENYEEQGITTTTLASTDYLLTSNSNNNDSPESLEDPIIESNPEPPTMAFLKDDHEHYDDETKSQNVETSPYLSSTTTEKAIEEEDKEEEIVYEEKVPTPAPIKAPTEEPTTTTTSTTISTTTSSNLEFISFGLEDALLHPPDNNEDSDDEAEDSNPPLPIKITYDRDDFRSSLIPPTPPRGWKGHTGALLPNPNIGEKESIPISIADLQLQNAIMDVPISTSLYNNGFYPNLVQNHNENVSHSVVPGQVFDESSERIFEQPPPPPIDDNFHEYFKSNESFVPSLGIGMEEEKVNDNPSRIYSKFGVQDSYYRRVESKTPVSVPPAPPNNNRVSNFEPRLPPIPRPPPYIPRDYPYYEYDDDEGSYEVSQPPFILIQSPPKIPPTPQKPKGTGPFIVTPEPTTLPTTTTPQPAFKPIVAFPFKIPSKNTNQKSSIGGSGGPLESLLNIGLKLSGCNIYGKMYGVGRVIEELSSPCVECQCTELGVQCSELPCSNQS